MDFCIYTTSLLLSSDDVGHSVDQSELQLLHARYLTSTDCSVKLVQQIYDEIDIRRFTENLSRMHYWSF